MPNSGKTIGLAFLVIMVALVSALMIPEFFDNLINQQNSSNKEMHEAMRILIAVFIVTIVGGSMKVFVWGDKDV